MRLVLATATGVIAVLAATVDRATGTRPQGQDTVAYELFMPGIVSTPLDELNAAFTPDGRELYWSINSAQAAGAGAIVVSRLRGNRWSAPEIASFSGQYSDYDPFVSPDGRHLYFISNRPKGAATWNPQDFDIYVVDRQGEGWTEPRNLGAPVNSDAPEYYPSIASDGTMYLSTTRQGSRGFDIFRSRPDGNGGFGPLENLGEGVSGTINSAEIDNYVAPDQSFIVFASGRPGGVGGQDLWVSFATAGTFGPARLLPRGINSTAREYTPIGSPDGRYLYWASMRGFTNNPPSRRLTIREFRDSIASIRNGNGNLYRTPIENVLALRPQQ